MAYVVAFLERTRAPLLVNLYSYFVYTYSLLRMDMSFALFTSPPETVVRDGEYAYRNLFESTEDALYTTVEKLGDANVRVVASTLNAMTYNQNLVWHVRRGTPQRSRRWRRTCSPCSTRTSRRKPWNRTGGYSIRAWTEFIPPPSTPDTLIVHGLKVKLGHQLLHISKENKK
jgi:hypothetical protein